MKRSFSVAMPSLIASLALLLVTSCTYVTPEAENELSGLEKANVTHVVRNGTLSIKKSVFGYKIIQGQNRKDDSEMKSKDWLCGWAPVTQSGDWKGSGGLSATPYRSRHCNMQWRFSEDGDSLQALNVDLNYPNDSSKWDLLFTIPITAHYFYEKDVDSRGRELNKYRKVSDRKNWQLQPVMDLDLKGIVFHDQTRRPSGWYWRGYLTDVFDVEISEENGQQFFGFNATHVYSWFGSKMQHVYRFNFLEIKDNPKFKQTFYDPENAKYMNILHILGYQPDGSRKNEFNYAAHWDISKPVEFCLNGFPELYEDIGHDVIDEMNQAMEKIGAVKKGQKAFVVSEKEMKYDFDLRCPSITWIDDPKLSFRAPLGIGLVNTNIRTGEILWGGAVIWGGLIDYIVNRASESISDQMAQTTNQMLSELSSEKGSPYFSDINQHLDMSGSARRFINVEEFIDRKMTQAAKSTPNTQGFSQELNTLIESLKTEDDETRRQELKNLIAEEIISIEGIGGMSAGGYTFDPNATGDNPGFNTIAPLDLYGDDDIILDFKNAHSDPDQFVSDMKSYTGMGKNVSYDAKETEAKNWAQGSGRDLNNPTGAMADFLHAESYTAFDANNTVEHHYEAVSNAVFNMNAGLERLAAAKTFIKNVTLHELGHVVGLGHQFAGNKVPEKGTVPEKIYQKIMQEELPYGHYYSSIMDYMSGHTEVSLPYEKVKMKFQDELTLSYLYKQEYATFVAGDDEFTMIKMRGNNGIIPSVSQDPETGNTVYTRYFPQCSDIDAWLSTDPYCRRWDRGHDAPSMVQANEKEYTDSFLSRLNSFTSATGGNVWWSRYRLWTSTYNLMNYNRTFYDKLRYELMTNPLYRSVFDKIKKDQDALYSFADACVDPTVAPKEADKGELWAVDFAKLALQPTMDAGGYSRVADMNASLTESDYESLYQTYKDVLGSRNSLEMSDSDFSKLEKELNENGVAYSEVQKLCRASKKTLDTAKLLLSLKGPDHRVMKANSEIVPTGLRGGEATSDYSKIWGTYSQLGLLPIKLATLDVLTSTASTMRYWWWRFGKPKYSNPNDGKYGYFSMYPKQFTDLVGTSVRNNMGFGGTDLYDSATMSMANIYTYFYLFRTFSLSNDTQARGFDTNYISDLKKQTEFTVQIAPVLLETIKKPGKEKRYGFIPKLFNFAKRQIIDLDSAYALPGKEVIIRGNDAQIIMPLTKMRYLNQDSFYVWAIEVTYDKTRYDDPLIAYSIKTAIDELTVQELGKCIDGPTGLSSFFDAEIEEEQGVDEAETDVSAGDEPEAESNDRFAGFDIRPEIARDQGAQRAFEESVDKEFAKYHNRKGPNGENLTPEQIGCEQSKNGVGLVTSTALSLNGFFLPQIYDFIRK